MCMHSQLNSCVDAAITDTIDPAEVPGLDDIASVLAHVGRELINADKLEFYRASMQDYIWIYRDDNGVRRGACTACGKLMDNPHYGHKSTVQCPHCAKIVQARFSRLSHKTLIDTFYAVEWLKSVLDPNVVVMIGTCVERDSSGARPWEARNVIVPCIIDAFRYGAGGVRYQRSVYKYDYRTGTEEIGTDMWRKKRDVRALGISYFGRKTDIIMSESEFLAAISDTPFARTWALLNPAIGRYCSADHSPEMYAIARRPFLEYMAKLGFRKLARDGLDASYMHGVVNHKGKTAREILKLSQWRYSEIRSKRVDLTQSQLAMLHFIDNQFPANRCKAEDIVRLCDLDRGGNLAKILGFRKDIKIIRYILRHAEDHDFIQVLRDYLTEAYTLGMDLDQDVVAMPKDLYAAHERSGTLMRDLGYANHMHYLGDVELQRSLEKRLPELRKKYTFEACGLILRPFEDLRELIKEGNILNHCVASYSRSYAEGNTILCSLRKIEEPDKPWRTIEFRADGRKAQDRGYRNDRNEAGEFFINEDTAALLDAFWEMFGEWRDKGRKAA